MQLKKTLFLIIFLFKVIQCSVRNLYCGDDDCYDILKLTNQATPKEVRKQYRRLSKQYHPDLNRKKDTTQIFMFHFTYLKIIYQRKINQAYEILKDEHLRKSYDRYLSQPERSQAYHYYDYYRSRYTPKHDPINVVLIVSSLFSFLQYVIKYNMYEKARTELKTSRQFKNQVDQIYERQKMESDNPKFTQKSYNEVEKEAFENLNIHGGWGKPQIRDLLLIKLILLPITIALYLYSVIRWTVLFRILNKPYGEKEQIYLTQCALNLSTLQWEVQIINAVNLFYNQQNNLEVQKDWIKQQLWITKNYDKFIKEQRYKYFERKNRCKVRKRRR